MYVQFFATLSHVYTYETMVAIKILILSSPLIIPSCSCFIATPMAALSPNPWQSRLCYISLGTKVHTTTGCDTWFPNLDEMDDWYLAETLLSGEEDGIGYDMLLYKRK